MTAPAREALSLVRLRGGAVPIELLADGLRHPRSVRFGGAVFTRYEDVTHFTLSAHGLRLGTRSGSFWLRRRDFREPGDERRLVEALRDRIAGRLGGSAQLARMSGLDRLAASPLRAPVSQAIACACVAIFGLQLLSPVVASDGVFSAMLVRFGEGWRLVTANFLHAGGLHLVLNVMGLVVLGGLAERSLSSPRVGPVLALAGLGAMAASYFAGYQYALGASGLVSGLAGALLWLELRVPEALPVVWRLPRRLFVGLVAFDTLALLAVPGIAHAAHAGGLVAGALGAAALGPRAEPRPASGAGVRVLNALALGAVLLAGVTWLRHVASPDPEALARRGTRLLEETSTPPDLLNNEAWRIAISKAPSAPALEVALRMAERAAEETDWSAPAILDTLAEVHFLAGRSARARELARAAIALAPGEPYYREQLRRFEGERPAHDRPPDPRDPPRSAPRQPLPGPTGPGLRI